MVLGRRQKISGIPHRLSMKIIAVAAATRRRRAWFSWIFCIPQAVSRRLKTARGGALF
ncbi:MAG: hypothetical protein IJ640_04870 [Prevotella sp.]|nr:hypothetical protein [Prevotella sp.]MBR1525975.1 hypothetical protein [Prevotella sp.]